MFTTEQKQRVIDFVLADTDFVGAAGSNGPEHDPAQDDEY
jgi:hypothetical protein